jgi:hypothetical protein
VRKSFKLVSGATPRQNMSLTLKMRPIPETETPTECPGIEPVIIGLSVTREFVAGGVDYPYVAAPSETTPVLLSLSQYIDGRVEWEITPSGYAGLITARVDVVNDHPQFSWVFISTVDGSPWWFGGYQKEFVVTATGDGFKTEKFIVRCRS